MDAAWNHLMSITWGNKGNIAEQKSAVLRVAFYWFNFMPLSRGTAACGCMAIFALIMAVCGKQFTEPNYLPEGLQLDWEAILESEPANFEKVVCTSWLDKALAGAKNVKLANKDSVPSVSTVVKTLRDAMTLLNVPLEATK